MLISRILLSLVKLSSADWIKCLLRIMWKIILNYRYIKNQN
jgi:hypothetical protein